MIISCTLLVPWLVEIIQCQCRHIATEEDPGEEVKDDKNLKSCHQGNETVALDPSAKPGLWKLECLKC